MPASTLDLTRFADDLDRARNIYGPLQPDVRARLFALADYPSEETWQAARNLVITAKWLTMWQACLRFTDYTGYGVPTTAQVAAALAAAVH